MTLLPRSPAAKTDPRSEVERIKEASHFLRGTIVAGLTDADQVQFGEDDANLLKLHGVYQQYDRDTATERKQKGIDRDFQFMTRLRIAGGRLTAAQYLSCDGFADRFGNGTLRITTRQTFQYHGVLKGALKGLLGAINAATLTTFATCGDVVRNVMAPPTPVRSPVYDTLNQIARTLSARFLPQTGAYAEIWVDGVPVPDDGHNEEPLYDATYLPRKFKIGLATPDDNSTDVLTNDLAVIALFDGNRFLGANLAVGGGLGLTHNKAKTYARLASPLLFVEPEALGDAIEAVIKVQRDHGDRRDRKHARLKYLVAEKGLAWIKSETERHAGRSYDAPRPMARFRVPDLLGWQAQGDGRWFLGVPVPSGRIANQGERRLRTALRLLVNQFQPGVVLTPTQDILFTDLAEADRAPLEALLREHGVALAQDLAPVQRWGMACPALPTCGLALTEAERVREPILDGILERLTAHGLEHEAISVRITGCPNGCARPYAGDIGLIGRMAGTYALYLGGNFEGTRLSTCLLDKVAEHDIPRVLEPLLRDFAEHRQGIESFGDYCSRLGNRHLAELVADSLSPAMI
ncbi:Sulfite reductase (ferredoxin) [uncultured Gammaproteobacteria bacterium]